MIDTTIVNECLQYSRDSPWYGWSKNDVFLTCWALPLRNEFVWGFYFTSDEDSCNQDKMNWCRLLLDMQQVSMTLQSAPHVPYSSMRFAFGG